MNPSELDLEKNFDRFFDLPYSDRQLIVFFDEPITSDSSLIKEISDLDFFQRFDDSSFAKELEKSFKFTYYDLPLFIWKKLLPRINTQVKRTRMNNIKTKIGVKVQPFPKRYSIKFDLPLGHPRDGLIYAGHPAAPKVYYPIADFHRAVFEHKFSEIITILMNLGAKKITVKHVQGWGKSFSSKVGVSLPFSEENANVNGKLSAQDRNEILYEAQFEVSSTPNLPENLVWYNHENTWQQVVNGRLNFGLKNFLLNLQYQEDYGINAGLKMKIQKVGYQLGGEFERHQSTVWEIKGDFI